MVHSVTTNRSQLLTVACVAFFATGVTAPLRADMTIGDIIENVRMNEALYASHDIHIDHSYSIGDHKPAKSEDGFAEITENNSNTHYVVQGDLFRLDRLGDIVTATGPLSANNVRAFDGNRTRVLDQDQIGNVFDTRRDGDVLRPHMLMLRDVVFVPLSTYLLGTDAIRAHPFSSLPADTTALSTYRGTIECDGHLCHKVWVTLSRASFGEDARWELWLAEDRNYIPMRMIAWTFNISKDIPLGGGECGDFREISPSIWFPFSARVVSYDRWTLMQKGIQKLRWQETYAVESASLDPDYAKSYFSDVSFPSGTAVYEIENDEVTKSYRVGAPGVDAANSFSQSGSWLWLANVSVLIVAAAFVVARRRSPSRRSESAACEVRPK